MKIDFNDAVWATPPNGGRRNTVSDKVDVYITQTSNSGHYAEKQYMVIRLYSKKFAEVFKDADRLSIGFLGDYVLLKAGDGYKVYNKDGNPEIRIILDEVTNCGRDAKKLFGGYLLKVDNAAGIAYVDTSVGARA